MADTFVGDYPDLYCQDCGKKGCRVAHCGPLVIRKEHGSFCSPCWGQRLGDEEYLEIPRPFKFYSDGKPYPASKPSPQEVPDMGEVSPKLRSDEERLEILRKTQEEMRTFEGVDHSKIAAEALDNYWLERDLVQTFILMIIFHKAHANDEWIHKVKLKRSLKNLEKQMNHVQTCPKCKRIMKHVAGAIDYINIVPKAVTRENGEKALRSLAESNDMTEVEFKEWIDKTSDSIIKEMR